MEPERKIEKLLRKYAKRRRADLGERLQLHPANRRLLQDEIARQRAESESVDASLTIWEFFRQQWAILIGFALVIFFCATLWLPSLSKAKSKSQSISAMNNLKQIGMAAQIAAEENHGRLPASLDALTNDFLADKILTDPVSGKPFVYVAGGKMLDSLPSNAVLAYSPEDKKGRAVLLADGQVEYASRDRFDELTNRDEFQIASAESVARRGLQEKSVAPPAAASPTVTPPGESATTFGAAKSENRSGESGLAGAVAGLSSKTNNSAPAPTRAEGETSLALNSPAGAQTDKPALGVPAQFYRNRLIAGPEANFTNRLAISNASPVLVNFQMRQNGSAILVVDSDGSTYRGSLQFGTSSGRIEDQIAAHAESQAVNNVSFRVMGTNLTLNQEVVFSGQLLIGSNAVSVLQQTATDTLARNATESREQPKPAAGLPQIPRTNLRVSGTAEIDHTTRIEINALPIVP